MEQHSTTYSVREAAQKTGFTLKYIRDLLYAGRFLGAEKRNGRWVIPALALERWEHGRKGTRG
jgi:hypothetical protein